MIRYAKFAGTSVIGTLVDTLVLWLLSDFAFNKGYWGEYLISPILSFQAAVLVNYTISYFFVWKDRVVNMHSLGSFFKIYIAYNLSCSTIFLIRFGFLLIIERILRWDVVFCNLLAMCFSGIINFIVSNTLIFRKKC